MKYTRPSQLSTKMDILNYESLSLLSELEPFLLNKHAEFCEMLVSMCLKDVLVIKREINEEASFEIDDLIHATRIARSTLEDYLIQE